MHECWLGNERCLTEAPQNQAFGSRPLQTPVTRAINFLNFLDLAQKTALLCISMHASRFSFAFTYRYSFTGSGEADGVLKVR
ncbi:MAG: hypothetical protein ACM3SW_01760 [Actinomycetota bacterium]